MASKTKGGKKNLLLDFTDSFDLLRLPSDHNLVDKSKNLHCVVIALFYRKDKQDNYIQNMRVGLKLFFLKIYILNLLCMF